MYDYIKKEEIIKILSKFTSYKIHGNKITVNDKFFNRNIYAHLNNKNMFFKNNVTRSAIYASMTVMTVMTVENFNSNILKGKDEEFLFTKLKELFETKGIITKEEIEIFSKNNKKIVLKYIKNFKDEMNDFKFNNRKKLKFFVSKTDYEAISKEYFDNLVTTYTKSITHLSQFNLSLVINKYDDLSINSDKYLAKISKNNQGLCVGFSFLWLICMFKTYSKKKFFDIDSNFYLSEMNINKIVRKTELIHNVSKDETEFINAIRELNKDLNYFDIRCFYNNINKIKKSIDADFSTDEINKNHKKFINNVIVFNEIINHLVPSNNFYIIEVKKENNFCEKLYEFICKSMKPSDDHLCCLISSGSHMMALYVQREYDYLRISFYDPNTDFGEYSMSSRLSRITSNIAKNKQSAIKLFFKNLQIDKTNYFEYKKEFNIYISTFIKNDLYIKKSQDDSNLKNTGYSYQEWKNHPELASSMLFYLSKIGQFLLIKYLLKNIPQINLNKVELAIDSAPLYIAAQNCHTKVIKELLVHPKTDPNIKRDNGLTALYIAAQNGHAKVIKELLTHPKTDPNIKSNNGVLPIDIARLHKYKECLKVLSECNICL